MFVIEDSVPGGQLVELTLLQQLRLPRIVLRRKGQISSYMVVGAPDPFETMLEYETASDIEVALPSALREMQQRVSERIDLLEARYPWRGAD